MEGSWLCILGAFTRLDTGRGWGLEVWRDFLHKPAITLQWIVCNRLSFNPGSVY